ncbi:cytochrome c3 family protein [Planctomycetota bacterium]
MEKTGPMKIFAFARKHSVSFSVGIVFALLCFLCLNAVMAPLSKSQYCGTRCHEMNTAYNSWELSTHGTNKSGIRVECIDCHLPPKDKYFAHMTQKAYIAARDSYKHYFGGEYEIEAIRKEVLADMSSQTCLNCHNNLLANSSDKVVEIAHRASIDQPDLPDFRCLKCHENVGHRRQSKTEP